MLCTCCMEEHDLKIVKITEKNEFKGMEIEYEANYYYCENAEEYFADEKMISENDIAMKNAYRRKNGLLETTDIVQYDQSMV